MLKVKLVLSVSYEFKANYDNQFRKTCLKAQSITCWYNRKYTKYAQWEGGNVKYIGPCSQPVENSK